MRLHPRGVLLTVMAALAMTGITTAAASAALPEFKPVPTKKKFTSTSGEFVWRVPTENVEMSCAKSTTTGEITGVSTLGKVVTHYTGCQMQKGGSGPCPVQSPGAKAKEIVTDALKGELGTVSTTQAPSGVGLLLEPETGHALWTLAAIGAPCSMNEQAFEGNFAGEISVVGKKQLTDKLSFAPISPEKGQKIKQITVKRGTVKPQLAGFYGGLTETTIEGTDETAFEEALEVT